MLNTVPTKNYAILQLSLTVLLENLHYNAETENNSRE